MMYVVDQNLAGLAKWLQSKGIPCETITKLVHGSEDSRVKVEDPAIVAFLRGKKEAYTLITGDEELAKYCRLDGIPCIFSWDAILETIQRSRGR